MGVNRRTPLTGGAEALHGTPDGASGTDGRFGTGAKRGRKIGDIVSGPR